MNFAGSIPTVQFSLTLNPENEGDNKADEKVRTNEMKLDLSDVTKKDSAGSSVSLSVSHSLDVASQLEILYVQHTARRVSMVTGGKLRRQNTKDTLRRAIKQHSIDVGWKVTVCSLVINTNNMQYITYMYVLINTVCRQNV